MMEVTISALSLRQPWAAFVVYWQKWIENRYWNTSYRGEFLIHAAKGMTRLEFDEALEFARPVLGDKCPSEAELRARLQFGGIIGRARLVGVVPPRGRGTIDMDTVSALAPLVEARKVDLRWHMPEQFGFVLDDVAPLPFRPYRGQLNFFKVAA